MALLVDSLLDWLICVQFLHVWWGLYTGHCSLWLWCRHILWKWSTDCTNGNRTWPFSLHPAQGQGSELSHHVLRGGNSNVFIMHALGIKSYSSEGQEEGDLLKTGWQFGQAVGVCCVKFWGASSLLNIKAGVWWQSLDSSIQFSGIPFSVCQNFHMRQRDKNLLARKLLMHEMLWSLSSEMSKVDIISSEK